MLTCLLKHNCLLYQVKTGAVFERTGSFLMSPAIRSPIEKGPQEHFRVKGTRKHHYEV